MPKTARVVDKDTLLLTDLTDDCLSHIADMSGSDPLGRALFMGTLRVALPPLRRIDRATNEAAAVLITRCMHLDWDFRARSSRHHSRGVSRKALHAYMQRFWQPWHLIRAAHLDNEEVARLRTWVTCVKRNKQRMLRYHEPWDRTAAGGFPSSEMAVAWGCSFRMACKLELATRLKNAHERECQTAYSSAVQRCTARITMQTPLVDKERAAAKVLHTRVQCAKDALRRAEERAPSEVASVQSYRHVVCCVENYHAQQKKLEAREGELKQSQNGLSAVDHRETRRVKFTLPSDPADRRRRILPIWAPLPDSRPWVGARP